MAARNSRITPVVMMALGCALNWPTTSLLRLPSDTDRVTIMPVAVEIISAGSWETRPSPMVTMEYLDSTSVKVPAFITIPMMVPPIKLIIVISSDMVASPFTILVAPSMAP